MMTTTEQEKGPFFVCFKGTSERVVTHSGEPLVCRNRAVADEVVAAKAVAIRRELEAVPASEWFRVYHHNIAVLRGDAGGLREAATLAASALRDLQRGVPPREVDATIVAALEALAACGVEVES